MSRLATRRQGGRLGGRTDAIRFAALVLAAVAAFVLRAGEGSEQPSAAADETATTKSVETAAGTGRGRCDGTDSDLIDEHYPPAAAGAEGYAYHQTATYDLYGDGIDEMIHVIARAVKDGNDYSWDDGSPWHVYVDEPTGERTYLHSAWVQLGILEVAIISHEGPGADVLIQHEGGAGYKLHCAGYRGPSQSRTTDIAEYAIVRHVALSTRPTSAPRVPKSLPESPTRTTAGVTSASSTPSGSY